MIDLSAPHERDRRNGDDAANNQRLPPIEARLRLDGEARKLLTIRAATKASAARVLCQLGRVPERRKPLAQPPYGGGCAKAAALSWDHHSGSLSVPWPPPGVREGPARFKGTLDTP